MPALPLSPELVLVSPDLRELALRSLPEPGSFAVRADGAGPAASHALTPPPPPPLPLPAGLAPPTPPRRPTGRSAFSTVEVSVRVPLVLVAAAYLTVGLVLRVAGGLGLVVALVAGYSLLVG